MKRFSTFGLVLQVLFVFATNVYGIWDIEVEYSEAIEALSAEATESTKAILNAHNSPSLLILDYLVYGAEIFMTYLNKNDSLKQASLVYLREECVNEVNKMKREMQICLDGYGGELQKIINKVTTDEEVTVGYYEEQVKELKEMKNLLRSAKTQYFSICGPEARNTATAVLKEKLIAVIEGEELHSGLAAGKTEATKIPETLQKQLNGFLTELDDDAATAKNLVKSYNRQLIRSFRRHPRLAEIFKKKLDECNEIAKGTFKENLNDLLLHRLSIVKSICAELYSPKCSLVYGDILSPSTELIQVMLDNKKSEVKALFKTCVDTALLDKILDIRFSE